MIVSLKIDFKQFSFEFLKSCTGEATWIWAPLNFLVAAVTSRSDSKPMWAMWDQGITAKYTTQLHTCHTCNVIYMRFLCRTPLPVAGVCHRVWCEPSVRQHSCAEGGLRRTAVSAVGLRGRCFKQEPQLMRLQETNDTKWAKKRVNLPNRTLMFWYLQKEVLTVSGILISLHHHSLLLLLLPHPPTPLPALTAASWVARLLLNQALPIRPLSHQLAL